MLSLDLECVNNHIFEGLFKDYDSYKEQLKSGLIACPLCGSTRISRKYSGCSIHTKQNKKEKFSVQQNTFFNMVREFTAYVKENSIDVGKDFADTARAMHYGLEEKKNIHGNSSLKEIKELNDEGIDVIPVPDITKLEN